MSQVYQQGARNLLKLENEDVGELGARHSRRLQLQKQLKQQIEGIEKTKRDQRQHRISQEREHLRSEQAYLDELGRRQAEANRKRESKINRQEVYDAGSPPSRDDGPNNRMSFKEFKAKRLGLKDENKSESVLPCSAVSSPRLHSSQHPGRKRPLRHLSSNPYRLPHKPTATESESQFEDSQETAKREEYLILESMILQVQQQIKAQEAQFRRQIDKAKRDALKAVQEKKKLQEEFTKLKMHIRRMEDQPEDQPEDLYDASRFASHFSKRDKQAKQYRSSEPNMVSYYKPESPVRPSRREQLVHR